MNCPTRNGKPYNKFLTPDDVTVKITVLQISPKNVFTAYLQYVQDTIDYVPDTISCRVKNCWQIPVETLKKGMGNSDDMSFLLASLLLTNFDNKTIWVTLGKYSGQGHTWVEIITSDNIYYVLESTTGQYFTRDEAYKNNYIPKMYVYIDGCNWA